ncbi:hypothetical protein [Caulobacter sp.]|uniref:hypothetical protein n=1 Tax=Caulobacter sp. TaxID=78 RepID=UPI001B2E57A1|nr:hypothetical protein [Caulobacter sp.]MBO9547131.1 hypothetical protein [Caulobacter sp.]
MLEGVHPIGETAFGLDFIEHLDEALANHAVQLRLAGRASVGAEALLVFGLVFKLMGGFHGVGDKIAIPARQLIKAAVETPASGEYSPLI